MCRYEGKIKVVCNDLTCFSVDPETLQPIGCGCYDPWAWNYPEDDPIETITSEEWYKRLRNLEKKKDIEFNEKDKLLKILKLIIDKVEKSELVDFNIEIDREPFVYDPAHLQHFSDSKLRTININIEYYDTDEIKPSKDKDDFLGPLNSNGCPCCGKK